MLNRDVGDGYFAEYTRKKNKNLDMLDLSKNLLTDRESYMSYLEITLEKTHAACMTVRGFSESITQLQSQVLDLEAKVQNAAKIAKSYYCECSPVLDTLETRMHTLERQMSKLSTDCKLLSADVPGLESSIKMILEKDGAHRLGELELKELENRLLDKMTKQLQSWAFDSRTIERAVKKQLEIQMEELVINQNAFCKKIHVEIDTETTRKQKKEFEMLEDIDKLRKDFKELRTSLLGGVDKIINENKSLTSKDIQEAHDRASRAEQTCTRLAEDLMKKVEAQRREFKEQIRDVEGKLVKDLRESVKYLDQCQRSLLSEKASLTPKRPRVKQAQRQTPAQPPVHRVPRPVVTIESPRAKNSAPLVHVWSNDETQRGAETVFRDLKNSIEDKLNDMSRGVLEHETQLQRVEDRFNKKYANLQDSIIRMNQTIKSSLQKKEHSNRKIKKNSVKRSASARPSKYKTKVQLTSASRIKRRLLAPTSKLRLNSRIGRL